MKFQQLSFGQIRLDGIEYGYGVVVDRGEIRERQNRAKLSHSSRSDYPFSCQPLSLVRQP